MSTRANVIVYDPEQNESLVFYRHSDGYPEGIMPTLKLFLSWMKEDRIRDNLCQSAGWLVIIGAMEYKTIPKFKGEEYDLESSEPPKDWKCGAYEPTTCIHGDIEYLYVIDLKNKTIKMYDNWDDFKKVSQEMLEQIITEY